MRSYSRRQLYALGETLGDSVTRKEGGRIIYGGGGGPSPAPGPAAQSNQYSNLSPYIAPYITSVLGAAQQQAFNIDPTTGNITGVNPYTAYGMNGAGMSPSAQQAAQSSVAGFSPLQQQSFQGAGQLQTPGQFGMATGAAGQGTMQALGAGQNYQNMATNPYAVGAYMNPYVQQSLAPQLQLLGQQTGIQSAGEQAAATSSGAFGGSREALANSLVQQTGNLAAQQAIGQGYNTAYNNAQQAMQYGAGLGLQGAQAGIAGAGQLGQLGTSQLAAQQGILGLQNTYGTQQQQNQQNIINQAMQNYQTAQAYPMQQLTQLKNLAQGLPMTDVTTTEEAPAPTTFGQLTGLGLTGLGAAGAAGAFNNPATTNINVSGTQATTSKKGGMIKKYASGGLVDLSLYNTLKGTV